MTYALIAGWLAFTFIAFALAGAAGMADARMEAMRATEQLNAIRGDDYTERLIGLYTADKELHAAAERVDAVWLETTNWDHLYLDDMEGAA